MWDEDDAWEILAEWTRRSRSSRPTTRTPTSLSSPSHSTMHLTSFYLKFVLSKFWGFARGFDDYIQELELRGQRSKNQKKKIFFLEKLWLLRPLSIISLSHQDHHHQKRRERRLTTTTSLLRRVEIVERVKIRNTKISLSLSGPLYDHHNNHHNKERQDRLRTISYITHILSRDVSPSAADSQSDRNDRLEVSISMWRQNNRERVDKIGFIWVFS